VKPTINNKRLHVLGNIDLREVDKKIIYNTLSDDRYIFNDFFNFENNLNQIFNNTIISYLKSKDSIDKHLEVLDIENFTEGEEYNLSIVNVTIDSEIYNIYHKTDTIGIKGVVYKKLKLKSPNKDMYPNWGKIYVKYDYLEKIKYILNDPIKLEYYKKKQIYPIIKSVADKLITVQKMDPSVYVHNKLCFIDDLDCTYPCKSTKSTCKLIIHDKSIDGKDLLNKFIYKLIDMMCINKNNLDNILKYKIEPYELKKTINPGEIFFTYEDFKNDYIDTLLDIDNDYIRNINLY
jgi:hypothetical protein